MNKYICIGNLTKDPELRYTPKGTAVLSFDIAVNTKTTKDKTETIFWKCNRFGKGAEALKPYLQKGSKVLVEARAVENKWTKNDGTVVISKELAVEKIEFLSKKSGGENVNRNVNNSQQNIPEIDVDEESLPF